MYRSFQEILDRAQKSGRKKIVIAGGDDPISIKAAERAYELGMVTPIFVGERQKIEKLTTRFEIIEAKSPDEACLKAVEIVRNEQDAILMKGHVTTREFLKAVLDSEKGLRAGKLLSHVAVVESPYYHKLLFVTDGGMVIKPTLEQKKFIIQNAVEFTKKLGIEKPKVAILAAVEKVNPDMPETMDAEALVDAQKRGEIKDCVIEGPMALDLAVSKFACEMKSYKGEVAGDADILLMPDIAAGNISAKAMLYLGGAKFGGAVVGTTKPCVMLSRADTDEIKLNSIALGVVTCGIH